MADNKHRPRPAHTTTAKPPAVSAAREEKAVHEDLRILEFCEPGRSWCLAAGWDKKGTITIAGITEIQEHIGKSYGAIVLHHILQRFRLSKIMELLALISQCLADGGALHVIVPSLEWVAGQVLDEDTVSPVLNIAIHGIDGENQSSFTVPMLRFCLDKAGFIVRRSEFTQYAIMDSSGTKYPCGQNYCMGVKKVYESLSQRPLVASTS